MIVYVEREREREREGGGRGGGGKGESHNYVIFSVPCTNRLPVYSKGVCMNVRNVETEILTDGQAHRQAGR